MSAMDDEPQLRRSISGVFERMAGPVQWQDLRLDPEPRPLRGFLTRGSGSEAPWEFRFAQPVEGLAAGAVLWRPEQDERWRVTKVLAPDAATPLWAARVETLQPGPEAPSPAELDGLLEALHDQWRRSTLGALEGEDVHEALARLKRLAAHAAPGHPAVTARVSQRLALIKALLGACQAARGLCLRLEAAFRRLQRPEGKP